MSISYLSRFPQVRPHEQTFHLQLMKSKKLFHCCMPHFPSYLLSRFSHSPSPCLPRSSRSISSTIFLFMNYPTRPQPYLPSRPSYRSRTLERTGNSYSASSRKQHYHSRCKQHHRSGLHRQDPPSEQSVRPHLQRAERAKAAESHGTRKTTGLRRLCACTGDRGNRGNGGRRRVEEGYLQQDS